MKYELIDDPLCELDDEILCYDDCTQCPRFYDCMEVTEEEEDDKKMGKLNIDKLTDKQIDILLETLEKEKDKRRNAPLYQLRANLLGGMNSYILDFLGNEDIIDIWWVRGIPDKATEEDLMEIAEDACEFNRISYLFGQLVNEF